MLPPSHAGGGLGMMPNPELLAGLVDETTGDTLEDETSRENATKTAVTVRTSSLVPTGQGLPALPKKLVDRILSNEYIDFSELPPAKGKVRPPTPGLGRPSYPCTSRAPPPVKEVNSRPTYMGAVFCYICCCSSTEATSENPRIDGVCCSNRNSQQKVQVASLGRLRSKLQTRSGW